MARTITVKGIGKVSAKPDYIVISLNLESRHADYGKAMELAADSIQNLNEALAAVGFEKQSVKTTNFNVRTDYSNERDRTGNYKRVFNGYVVTHNLKIEFDMNMQRLSATLASIADCLAHPQLSIAFTVKDATAINEEMLRSATANARRKAEILCDASGVILGSLIAIDYNWGELNVYSNTEYCLAEECLAPPMGAKSIDIEPDDIDVSDTATFVWEIQQAEKEISHG